MFTGLITDVGEVVEVDRPGDLRAKIATSYDVSSVPLGASIACDGVCLTVIETGRDPRPWFAVEISAETVSKTNIGATGWAPGTKLNLERALRVGDELGGHIVSGHVDGVAHVTAMQDVDGSTRYTVDAPSKLAKFIAPKGSIALNGTSLTVNEVDGTTFGVNLIPHTKQVTTWGQVKTGDPLNIEIDTMARYVARLSEMG
ncbi:riboflavin synthase [Maribius pontilimi]|uniref:Riboflavin synthase n=1 Tax=Palleronia pontilimi TaxID=1964209 RepID=A0A934II45_9RHOB|nr:riboflavin synthase [Palleronia pontilimi]MBJ3763467.1 riboflavin synthase [Palleronia pontilimi]